MTNKNTHKKIDIWDVLIVTLVLSLFIFLIGDFALSEYKKRNPYDYNYYYNLYINKVDLKELKIESKNEYSRERNYEYVQIVDVLYPHDKQEVLNILYTAVDAGVNDVTFYCPKDYMDCGKDAEDYIYNKETSIINTLYKFVHPYNSYKSLSCSHDDNTGEVTYHIEYSYEEDTIKEIEAKIDEIYPTLVYENDTVYNNIKRIYDYLANTVTYDKTKADFIDNVSDVDSVYDSTRAYGALIEHQAICGGYTDATALFLDRMGITNYRLRSSSHTWNALIYNGKWVHLDSTWGDGRYTNGNSFLNYKYLLIDTNELYKNDTESHTFDENIWSELKR